MGAIAAQGTVHAVRRGMLVGYYHWEVDKRDLHVVVTDDPVTDRRRLRIR